MLRWARRLSTYCNLPVSQAIYSGKMRDGSGCGLRINKRDNNQDAMRDAYAPWSRPRHDWSEIRHFVSQMAQLDRREFYDGLRLTHAYVPW